MSQIGDSLLTSYYKSTMANGKALSQEDHADLIHSVWLSCSLACVLRANALLEMEVARLRHSCRW